MELVKEKPLSCTKASFSFDNTLYEQCHGVTMGHPGDKYYPVSRKFYIRSNNKKKLLSQLIIYYMNSVMVNQWGHPWHKYYTLSRSFYIRRNDKKVNSIGILI